MNSLFNEDFHLLPSKLIFNPTHEVTSKLVVSGIIQHHRKSNLLYNVIHTCHLTYYVYTCGLPQIIIIYVQSLIYRNTLFHALT